MHDQAPDIFEIVKTWLYSKEITVNVNGKDEPCQKSTTLVDLYLFGAKYGMPNLRNGVIDLIIRNFETQRSVIVKDICRVYKNTAPESPLRKVILATYLQRPRSSTDTFEHYKDHYLACPEFLFDLARALESQRNKPLEWHIHDPCQYHEHGKDEEKCPAALETEKIAKAKAEKSSSATPNLKKSIASMKGDHKDSSLEYTAIEASIEVSKPPASEKDSKSGSGGREHKSSKSGLTTTKTSAGESRRGPSAKDGKSGPTNEESKGPQSILQPETKALTDRTKSVHFEKEKEGKEEGMENGGCSMA